MIIRCHASAHLIQCKLESPDSSTHLDKVTLQLVYPFKFIILGRCVRGGPGFGVIQLFKLQGSTTLISRKYLSQDIEDNQINISTV